MNAKLPIVSIVAAHYNNKKLAEKFLDSLRRINYPESKVEIIIVDNTSVDDSVEFIKDKYKNVKVITNKQNNYCQACNLGIKNSIGSYVVLLNNDIVVKKEWLLKLVDAMENDETAGAATSMLLKKNGVIQNAGLNELPDFYWDERGAGKSPAAYNEALDLDAISGACVMYKRSALKDIGLLDEDFGMYGEDVDMSIRLKKKGWRLVYVPSSVAYHKKHGSSNEAFARKAIEENRLLLIAKHYPEKIARSLAGSSYFIAKDKDGKSGRILDIMPRVFSKLLKEHGSSVTDAMIKEIFGELKKIANYENKKMEDELKDTLEDLVGTRKDREYHKSERENYGKEIEIKNKIIKEALDQLKEKESANIANSQRIKELNAQIASILNETVNLSNQLKEKESINIANNHHIQGFTAQIASILNETVNLSNQLKEKESINIANNQRIQELAAQLNSIQNSLHDHKEEISTLSGKLAISLDNLLMKDTIIFKNKAQIKDLSDKLKISLEEELALSGQLNSVQEDARRYKEEAASLIKNIQEDVKLYKEETSFLSDKLKTSLDQGMHKDAVILERDAAIAGKDNVILEKDGVISEKNKHIDDLSIKLKISIDQGIGKDNDILEKSQHIDSLYVQLKGLNKDLKDIKKELEGVYSSTGFRFVLNPLWKFIWYSRIYFKRAVEIAVNFIWTGAIFCLSPVLLIHALFFILEHISELLFGWMSRYLCKKRGIVAFDELTVSVVIPNWNGLDLLKKCLSSLYETEDFKDNKHEILVVDDASDQNISEAIKGEFPYVKVIRNARNMGFGRTCNRGIKEARGELIVLLNNDIMASNGFLEPLKAHFKDQAVFAVSPKLYYWDMKSFNYGMHMGKFKDGYLNLWNEAETGHGDKVSQASPTIFAVGGAMCFRKKDFLWLGGFDDIYRPNCWEDIDISYRAQKRGLKVLYEPRSLMYHKGAATLNYVRHKEIKNELLFMWKNLADIDMIVSHLNELPRFLYHGKYSSRLTFLKGYLWAFTYIIPAMTHRFQEYRYRKLSDKKILDKSMRYYRNFMRNNFTHSFKKTILLITPFIVHPLNSGGKLRIYNLYKRLSKKYNIILLSLIHDEREADQAGSSLLKEIFKEIYTVHPKTQSAEFLFPKRYKHSFSSFLIEKLKEIQEKYPVELVHIESNELLYLTKHIKHAPVVYTEHDISILSPHKSYYKKTIKDIFLNFSDYLKIIYNHSLFYKKLDKIIILSNQDMKAVKAFSPTSDYSLITTGVDLDRFRFKEKTGKNKSIIFVGHYPHYPNEEAVVYFCKSIFPIIKKAVPDSTLMLVGSDPTDAVKELSAIKGVKVIGTVLDVEPYLQNASVFICPFNRSAGVKGKVLEAMATGTPVVCTTRGSYGIEAENNSSILIADNPMSFAKSVIRLFNDDELYRKISRHARLLVEEKYDWNKLAQKLDKVYADITEGKHYADTHVYNYDSVNNIIKKIDEIVRLSLSYSRREGSLDINLNPEELHIELTHLCNSRCIACDIWDYHKRNNKSVKDELSLSDIKRFISSSRRLKDIKTVVLSGGEAFLRQDFVDICFAIKELLPQASLGILSNGVNTEIVISKTKEIIKRIGPESIWIGSSLDGLGDAYDRMRGVDGGFKGFTDTLKFFRRELPEVRFSATFVLTPFNIDQLVPCWEFADKNNIDFFAQFGVPKEARSADVFKWSDNDLAKIDYHIKEIIERMIKRYADLEDFDKSLKMAHDKVNLLTTIYYWSHLVDFQKTRRRFAYDCDAAFKFMMADPYGNIFFCPLLKDKIVGNIKDANVDDLWVSSESGKIRDFICSGKCSCWLVCTVFPLVSKALILYGDRSAKDVLNRKKASSVISEDFIIDHRENNNALDTENVRCNRTLNEEEFRSRKIVLESMPQGITIGTNYKCNANCAFCLGGDYRPFDLKLYKDYFEPRIGDMIKKAEYVSFCGMGELLLVPDIKDFLRYVNTALPENNKIITTNGLALKSALAGIFMESKYSIQVSLHASNARLHEQITGLKGGFDNIISQVRFIISRRRNRQSPHVTLVFVVNTMNIEDLPAFVELAASLGVDSVQVNYMLIFKSSHMKLSCFFMQDKTNEMFLKAMGKADECGISLNLPPSFSCDTYLRGVCSDPWKNIYIDTEGAVLPCCYSGEHFGELKDKDIFSIWNNDKYQHIRSDLGSGNALAMCRYCINSNPANVNLINAHVSFRPEAQKLIVNN